MELHQLDKILLGNGCTLLVDFAVSFESFENRLLALCVSVISIMSVPLSPYPSPPVPFTPSANGSQSQLVCSGCVNLLLYPVGATSVCCVVCKAVTFVHLQDMMLRDAITKSDKTLEGFAQIALKMRLHHLLKTEFGLHLECCGKVVYAEEMILV
ncbi:hypothetical protein POM88_016312 [Heracleum sosnowskyi]|uniref:Zinc finger LSD1-type domain-containing protein n=1 Tax=Heracleum sosnowskyi TaxID=360622 RepID=A0AAD8ILH7_9APIA|nr:hypothetical protein POM88_016312 [Heracleum sosnowskyi]